jgi:hypothetical protein
MKNEDQTEMDYEDAEVLGETKAERFSRVVNPRFKVAMKRIKMIRQMFEGPTANNYEFTDAQRVTLVKALTAEVELIDRLMTKRLHGEPEDVVTI